MFLHHVQDHNNSVAQNAQQCRIEMELLRTLNTDMNNKIGTVIKAPSYIVL